jgi:methionyl-tRNA formyltransferase
MDRQIRIPEGAYKALRSFAEANRISIRVAAAAAVGALSPHVVVAVNSEGNHDVVEVYTNERHAFDRRKELTDTAFTESRVSVSSRASLLDPEALRKYGPDWIAATGWTPSN